MWPKVTGVSSICQDGNPREGWRSMLWAEGKCQDQTWGGGAQEAAGTGIQAWQLLATNTSELSWLYISATPAPLSFHLPLGQRR